MKHGIILSMNLIPAYQIASLAVETAQSGTRTIQAPFHLTQSIPEKIKIIHSIGG